MKFLIMLLVIASVPTDAYLRKYSKRDRAV